MRSRFSALAAGVLIFVACSRSAPHAEATSPSASATQALTRAPAPPAAGNEPVPSDVAAPPADAEVGASGVASKQLRAGQGSAPPRANDCVRVSYTSWKRDGTFHGSSAQAGQPAVQCLRRMMLGVAEVVEHMSVGEQRRIWVPGKLTYRSNDGDEPAPTDDLTFELTLIDVLKAPETPRDLLAPPPGTPKTASGLALRRLRKGVGPRHSRPNERMTVRFSGWTQEGVLFESTELSGSQRPASVSRADVVRGVGEGLALMEVGEKARVWVPAVLAFGNKPRRGAPAGPLVYDLELIATE